jgi:signal peptidase I
MQFDFPTILFLAALLTGLIWALDAFYWSRKRKEEAGEDKEVKEPLIVEYSRSFFPIIIIVLLLRSFLLEPFRIPSGSMMPTLLAGDFILVNKFSYGIRLPVINKKIIDIGSPERGDVVVFRYPEDPSIDYIKRVIGLPGDEIRYMNKHLYINGKPIQYKDAGIYYGKGSGISMSGTLKRIEMLDKAEHNILVRPGGLEMAYPCMQNNRFVVPKGHYFVMGDNRDHSNDSRFWCAVPDKNLVGKAFMIWMHWDSAGEGLELSRIGDKIK